MWISAVIFSLVCCSEHLVFAAGTADDLLRLRNALLANYTKEILPVYNLTDKVYVYTTLNLLSILDFDELSGVLTVRCAMTFYWTDYRLTWNPSDHGGIGLFSVNSSYVWKPNVFLLTSADDITEFGSDSFDISVTFNGSLFTSPGKLIRSTCSVDMTKFPFDTQICLLQFMPWRNVYDIKLMHTHSEILVKYYIPNGEWSLDRTSVGYFTGYGANISVAEYTIYITRKPTHFLLSTSVPFSLIIIINQCVFLLPTSSGERISFTITMFLSEAVYMTLIADTMPKVSDPIANMSYYLAAAMLYSSVLIVLTIFTLRCDAVESVDEFPEWLRKAVYRWKMRSKKNKISAIQDADNHIENVQNQSEGKEHNSLEEISNAIGKRDVVNFIDKCLFLGTLVIIMIINIAGSIFMLPLKS